MSDTARSELAIFGGRPRFATPRPVGQLASPDIESFLPQLRVALENARIDRARFATELERRLAAYHDVDYCITFANAGLAIIALLRILGQESGGEVLMPAFSYRGLPHFAQWAGLSPRFCDVGGPAHGLDADSVRGTLNAESAVILAVNNFNGPCDVELLQELATEHGIPIIFDSVYGVGCTRRGRPLGSFGMAEVFSLHATKLLNGFEGGYVTTNDVAFAARIREENRERVGAELNEVHAAMAMLSLDGIAGVVTRNEQRFRAYEKMCESLPALRLIPYVDESLEKHNYEMALVEVLSDWPLTRDETVKVLRAENILITSYYNPPLHLSAHAPKGAVPQLPISEDLARRFFQLPVGELTSIEDIDAIGALLHELRESGASVAERLREREG